MSDDRNDLAYWYPRIRDLVATPKTGIVRLDGVKAVELLDVLDGKLPPWWAEFLHHMVMAVDYVAGPPAFLRTGHTSGKHDWVNTCDVRDTATIGAHIVALVEFSSCVDFFGLPLDTWAVREMLAVESPFNAFNGFPVSRERRYFLHDGAVVGHHAYWPPMAIQDHTTAIGWEAQLDALNFEPPGEVDWLSRQTEKVGAVVDGDWSVDWLHTTDRGWVLIDMADAHESWQWQGHPTAPVFA